MHVRFSSDGRWFATAGINGVITLWDVATGRHLATLPGVSGRFYPRLDFSPDGSPLFAGSLEGTVLFWRVPSWEEIEAAEKKQPGP